MSPMQIDVVPDEPTLAVRAADAICTAVLAKPDAVLGLPTGNTPIRAYREIARRIERGQADFRRAIVYAIDEFADATRTTPGTNSVFYREHLRFPVGALHIPNPAARDANEHIVAFADALRRSGGFDLCVLGIGRNGHIAFNEPGSAADAPACVVDLAPASREAHAATFGSLDAVPARGMTLGVDDILAARAILVLAHGARKATIVRAAIEDAPSAEVPASWLQTHAAVTWLLDEAAASQLAPR